MYPEIGVPRGLKQQPSIYQITASSYSGERAPCPPLSRLLSRACRASTFHNIPQMKSLLAGCFYKPFRFRPTGNKMLSTRQALSLAHHYSSVILIITIFFIYFFSALIFYFYSLTDDSNLFYSYRVLHLMQILNQ